MFFSGRGPSGPIFPFGYHSVHVSAIDTCDKCEFLVKFAAATPPIRQSTLKFTNLPVTRLACHARIRHSIAGVFPEERSEKPVTLHIYNPGTDALAADSKNPIGRGCRGVESRFVENFSHALR